METFRATSCAVQLHSVSLSVAAAFLSKQSWCMAFEELHQEQHSSPPIVHCGVLLFLVHAVSLNLALHRSLLAWAVRTTVLAAVVVVFCSERSP